LYPSLPAVIIPSNIKAADPADKPQGFRKLKMQNIFGYMLIWTTYGTPEAPRFILGVINVPQVYSVG
jgi:hypothetical protein